VSENAFIYEGLWKRVLRWRFWVNTHNNKYWEIMSGRRDNINKAIGIN
jgi:hypothetical protein